MKRTLVPVVAVLGAGVLLLVALALGGHDALAALRALLDGAFGTRDRFFSITLVRATPLILAGLAVALAFRAGVWNIGAEGQFYAGACVAAWLGIQLQMPALLTVPILFVAASAAGAAWAVVPAWLKIRRGVNEVISTLLMNFVGLYLAATLVRGPLQESRGVFPQTDPIAETAHLPLLIPGTRFHAGFAVAVLLALIMWLVLARTDFGLQVRAVGASPSAARIAGRIKPGRVIASTLLLSGALAGIAGGVEVMGVTFALYENLSPGYGYTAIAVALLGGLHPLGVVIAGILFGALDAGASAMQRTADVPAVWVRAIEAVVILSVVVANRRLRERKQ
jgi:ABC-type uncharacterized transport system permease subunit